MQRLILLKGLPASGKSTWAKEQVTKEPGRWKRINKDDLRAMLDNNKWSRHNEEFVLLMRDTMALAALDKGFNVIIDDTNLHPKHEQHLRELAKEKKAKFEVKDFTDVTLEECIERDRNRWPSVGEVVIRRMYNQFLRPVPKPPEYLPGKPEAIICDLDGTLALLNGRDPYDASKCEEDLLNEPVAAIIRKFIKGGTKVLFVSGRSFDYYYQTKFWLDKHKMPIDRLWMRKIGDSRRDSIIKEEIYNEHIAGRYNVLFVLDDRNQMVDLWRYLGLTCLQVAEGDF